MRYAATYLVALYPLKIPFLNPVVPSYPLKLRGLLGANGY